MRDQMLVHVLLPFCFHSAFRHDEMCLTALDLGWQALFFGPQDSGPLGSSLPVRVGFSFPHGAEDSVY
jgi:hypothetical protein